MRIQLRRGEREREGGREEERHEKGKETWDGKLTIRWKFEKKKKEE